jgi:hypothetical protein
MTRVLVWKEIREQWTSAVAMLVLGGLLFAIAYLAYDRVVTAAAARVILICMAWISGVIAGTQTLASERESGMLHWLDALPIRRRVIWRAKVVASAGIVIAVILGLYVVAVAVTHSGPRNPNEPYSVIPLLHGVGPAENPGANFVLQLPVLLALGALNGLSCGVLGSAIGGSALAAFGCALVVEVLAAPLLLLLVYFGLYALQVVGLSEFPIRVVAVLFAGISALMLDLSARYFGRLDRLRGKRRSSLEVGPWRSLVWLTWRQGRAAWWTVAVGGIVAGGLIPTKAHLWPIFGLLLGVVAGTGAFGADQAGRTFILLGERRLSPGRLWLVKHAIRFSPLLVALVIYAGSSYLHYLTSTFGRIHDGRSEGVELPVGDALALLMFGPITGYAIAQFVGMVCRKESVAAVVALLIVAGIGVLWLPSLVVGGVHWWQWLLPAAILLSATRLATWPWMTGRLATWKPALGMTAAVLLAAAATAGAIAYRVVEPGRWPPLSDPFDVTAFELKMRTAQQEESGRQIRSAIVRFQQHLESVSKEFGPPASGVSYLVELVDVLNARRWHEDSDELDDWLDRVLNADWLKLLQGQVASLESSGRQTSSFVLGTENPGEAHRIGQLILARSLRRTSRGEIEPALDDMTLALRFAREQEQFTDGSHYRDALAVEGIVAQLLPDWALKAASRPDLIRRAIELVGKQDAMRPPLSDAIKVDYLALACSLQKESALYMPASAGIESDLIRFSRAVPWEEVRCHAIFATLYAGWIRTAETPLPKALKLIEATEARTGPGMVLLDAWLPNTSDVDAGRREAARFADLSHELGPSLTFVPAIPFERDAATRTQLRAVRYELALMLYQIEKGKPAEGLTELVPDYLPELLADLFGDRPFRYRVSGGERLPWTHEPHPSDDAGFRSISPGQGILWSVGPDLVDNGGRVNDVRAWPAPGWTPGGDIIFVVPVVKK